MGSLALYKGIILAFLSSSGNMPCIRDRLVTYDKGCTRVSITGLISLNKTSSCPGALFFSLPIIFFISSACVGSKKILCSFAGGKNVLWFGPSVDIAAAECCQYLQNIH